MRFNHSTTDLAKKSTLFRSLVEEIERCGISYCLLSGHHGYPGSIESDVDILVDTDSRERLAELSARVASANGGQLVQLLQHETGAYYFAIAVQEGPLVTFLHPDFTHDFRRNGRLWLKAGPILAGSVMDERGLRIPSPVDEFIYYFIKRIDKMDLSKFHFDRLCHCFALQQEECQSRLRQLLPLEVAESAIAAFASRDASRLIREIQKFRKGILRSEMPQRGYAGLLQAYREIYRKVQRVRHRTGLSVAFYGPDGSGKTTAIASIQKAMAPAFRQTQYFHFRPSLLLSNRRHAGSAERPHASPPRSLLASLVKLGFLAVDYTLGFLIVVRPLMIRSHLVVFDRFFHDMLVDPKRYRLGAPEWLVRLLGHCLPKPDIAFFLDVPAEELWRRKQELPLEELLRQRDAYLKLAQSLPNAHVIDASRAPEEVTTKINQVLLATMEHRLQVRLGNRP